LIVADASPLIALAQINRLSLLHFLYGTVLIPEAVAREIEPTFETFGPIPAWLVRRGIGARQSAVERRWSLDPGESEAVALALEVGALLLIDELRGRRVALASGLEVVGTLGVMVRSKQRGLLERVEPVLEQLEQVDFWMSDSLRATILSEVGEL
jgi:uncharacterized protein